MKIFKKEPYYLTTDYLEVHTLITEYLGKKNLLKAWVTPATSNLTSYGVFTKRINMIDALKIGLYIGLNLDRYPDFKRLPGTTYIKKIYRMRKKPK